MSSGWFDLLCLHRYRGNKVCRVLCTCSGWFKHIEPPRTFSNHIITKIARCVEFCHMSSGWFDCTEPSLSTSLQGKQGVQGAYALVRGGSSTSNLIESSRNIITEIARCVGFCHMGSGWFDCTEPSLSTSLQRWGRCSVYRSVSRFVIYIDGFHYNIFTFLFCV